jgi:hypothetical protein
MPMENDPYQSENRFNLSAVAGNAFAVTPNDTLDLPVGVKAVDLANEGAGWQTVELMPVNAQPANRWVTFRVPPGAVRPVPLRVQRVRATGIGVNISVVAYTDGNVSGTI